MLNLRRTQMKNYTNLIGYKLIKELENLISQKTVAIIEYKDVFREVYLLEITDDKIMVYQKSDTNADKNEGIRKMFLSELILWDVVKTNINLEDWKFELKELEYSNNNFATY